MKKTVTITGPVGTTITYTTDNSDPTESNTALTVDGNVATVTVNEAMTIKAVAVKGELTSAVATAAYVIPEVNTVANIAAFRTLTAHFLRVRYGNFPATRPLYDEVEKLGKEVARES